MPRRAPEQRSAGSQHYVAFLRAINLAGHNRVPMKELRTVFAELRATDVETYLQSGNVVFRSARAAPELVAAAQRGITARFGLDVTVIVRTGRQLDAIIRANPFRQRGDEPAGLHVTFLAASPAPDATRGLTVDEAGPDEFALAGADVFLSCPGGYGRTKLTNSWFERRLGVPATTRNWRTVTTLATMAR